MDDEAAISTKESLCFFRKGRAWLRLGPLAVMTIGILVGLGRVTFLTLQKKRMVFRNQRLLKKSLVDMTDSALENRFLNALQRDMACSGHAFSDGFHEVKSVENSFSSPIME